ncbi:hypothetical protein [Flexistipes sinusarabici]|uniref:hypothetical protein n=1 Tax=Flexistipes sinusarabici TaxID=2352 RepID=UPI000EE70399|nr:hypothetical protein [Flexistipes sinusarabici]HCX72972.1 hypothetical protein [Candidatus Cloacimonas sp.]
MGKKLIITIFCLLFIASFSFAKDLADVISDAGLPTELSNDVSGKYFANSDTPPTQYIVGTIHSQGTRAFGTGSFSSKIYYDEDADNVSLSDGTFDSSVFSSWTAQ